MFLIVSVALSDLVQHERRAVMTFDIFLTGRKGDFFLLVDNKDCLLIVK
uniref:Bm1129 n=1 Tax=Brugia malayi TaxID=6279 RepID=A0A1I9G006_BRUMA|nr:Bm1129 [Brugia malayi]